MKFLRTIPLIFTILYSGIVSACPPGSVLQKGNGWEGCIQSSSASESGPSWKKQWGAVATDGAKGALGASIEADSKRSAEEIALRECTQDGGENCRIKIAYYNQCASVVSSYKAIYVQSAETREAAISEGMNRCVGAGEDGCQEFYSGCSLAKRIK
ncbi:DUF4189 domain-containing protein [Lysobacter yananisis]|uniref:DUF4189 domain-containing protein n=1 Tax=Lysobacter yananisis TaxID=1003114 RepID=A0ABY9P9N6_9GAMM|nr:DUF4189 domain-containing protein [Lysobacter yananisis]WMT02577.1 DUF4189 domain-containing protein [Lysobacter yananisis]